MDERFSATAVATSWVMRTPSSRAHGHQEKWGGLGHPESAGGGDIPIPARLMAMADVYDVLCSRRVYKNGCPTTRP